MQAAVGAAMADGMKETPMYKSYGLNRITAYS